MSKITAHQSNTTLRRSVAYEREYERVFLALFKLAMVRNDLKQPDLTSGNIYVQLYPQPSNCAVLYSPASQYAKSGPLHLNPKRKSWDEEQFQRIKPFIENLWPDLEPDNNEFYHHHVNDWNGLATALKLELS